MILGTLVQAHDGKLPLDILALATQGARNIQIAIESQLSIVLPTSLSPFPAVDV